MPKREEERNADHEPGEGRPLCPFCGSPEVTYLEKYGKWQCGKCERMLSYVSRGGGGRRYTHSAPSEGSRFSSGRDRYTLRGAQAKVTWQAVVAVIILFAIVAFLLSRC